MPHFLECLVAFLDGSVWACFISKGRFVAAVRVRRPAAAGALQQLRTESLLSFVLRARARVPGTGWGVRCPYLHVAWAGSPRVSFN